MKNQFEFDFSPDEFGPEEQTKNVPPAANDPVMKESVENDLEKLTEPELARRYSETVGIDPALRGFDRATMIAGIKDPVAELDRIRQIDAESDKEDLKAPYTK